ncbi:MAG: hypothetical protein IPH81_19010 [Candidatus Microthrix sp.]|nr:hypothetical protein [Candidatus Microthrix sp.]
MGPVGGLMLAGITGISPSGGVRAAVGPDRMANWGDSGGAGRAQREDSVVAAYLPVLGVLLVGGRCCPVRSRLGWRCRSLTLARDGDPLRRSDQQGDGVASVDE